jgi:HK97 family phage major capsid protein
MGKKSLVKVNGKSYAFDEDTKTMEEIEVAPEKEVEKEEEEGIEEEITEAAQKLMKSLGIDELKAKVDSLSKEKGGDKKISDLVDLEKLMKKGVDEMTAKEKIVGFFQAMMQSNHGALKALSEGVAADGGYLFPDEFMAEIIRDIANTPHMRSEVRVVPMKRDVMKIPTLATGPKVTWTAENAAKSTTTAQFNEATLTAKKMAAILYASDELIEDSTEIDIVQFIITLFSEVMGNEEDRVIAIGNGTTEPKGFATSGQGVQTISAGGNLTYDNIIDLEYLLPSRYTRGAKFFASRDGIKEMRKLKDLNQRPLWNDGNIAANQPATFHGYPVVEVVDLPDSVIYFGDLKKAYWFGDRKRMTVKISQDTETAFVHDQTAIRVVERVAGCIVLAAALKGLTSI